MAEGLEPVRSVESVKEMGQFNMEKAQADLIDVSDFVMCWSRDSGARVLLAVDSEGRRDNGDE